VRFRLSSVDWVERAEVDFVELRGRLGLALSVRTGQDRTRTGQDRTRLSLALWAMEVGRGLDDQFTSAPVLGTVPHEPLSDVDHASVAKDGDTSKGR